MRVSVESFLETLETFVVYRYDTGILNDGRPSSRLEAKCVT